MDNEKLSFRKRISLVKAAVLQQLLESKELSQLGSGNSKNGYYSLATIMEALMPSLVENDLDLDITMDDNEVVGTWIDCESDKVVDVVFKLGRLAKIIENLERLPQMQNAIQTEGSIKTYFRRYALTAFLNLPATDEIDSAAGKEKPSTPTPAPKPDKPKPKPTPAPPVPAKFVGLTDEQKTEIGKKDKNIVNFVLEKHLNGKSIDKVPGTLYQDFIKYIEHYEKQKVKKTSEKVTLEQIKLFEENIEDRKLDKDFWTNAVYTMFELPSINHWVKSDFIKFYGYISEPDPEKPEFYKVSNKELMSTMELKLKELEKKMQGRKGA